ncbi:MAG: isoleucine--tRNA ligase [Deltaproteobacteria bacterium]|nr:isoleucine--tRNA ligase [Deltaproteobacteria bacterium]
MANDAYKATLCLPQTDFPMKADLPRREPRMLAFWEEKRVYPRLLEQTRGRPVYCHHDGPPYANGHIHYGTILNKVLKDIVVKHHAMAGFFTKYRPGWDCHGLPIELAVERDSGKRSKDRDPLEVRRDCRAFAEKFIDIQRGEFRRLGGFGLWDEPYLTMKPRYEAAIVRGVAAFADRGAIYRGRRPVYWCASCRTALAEAEVEYKDKASPSIYVNFACLEPEAFLARAGLAPDGSPTNVMIWTTTPWTLPANLGIALHPDFDYRFFRLRGERVLLAELLAGAVAEALGAELRPEGDRVPGKTFEALACRHPFLDRRSAMVLAEYVTLDAGTGCVHTAPGHGAEDFVTGQKYGLDAYAPVDADGRFTPDVERWAGLSVWKANEPIVALLAETGRLANKPGERFTHSYPHCWRCKEPIVFRATPQWFIAMDPSGIRATALEQIGKVAWIPPWGENRIRGMIESRPDWCISRQRVWGVPTCFFHCADCGEPFVDGAALRHVADVFARDGSDAWWARPAAELLPAGAKCRKCGSANLEREPDILDVWFESGMSWSAVCAEDPELGVPVDLYLEGSDQHRGWFHTALLTGVGVRGAAPYKAVLTHGFVVDETGRPYSKSEIEKRKREGRKDSSFIEPDAVLAKYGAELLRLWTANADFRDDIVFSGALLDRLSDAYRKIRNTFRFCLGVLSDFDPAAALPAPELLELDRWALARFNKYVARTRENYDAFQFHQIVHQTLDLTAVDLSAFYLDIVKDRLYCEAKTGRARRSAQTAILRIAVDLARLLAPIGSFTAEEVWQHLPRAPGAPDSVFLAGLPAADPALDDETLLDRWARLRAIRSEVTKAIEDVRRAGRLGHSLDAAVAVQASGARLELLRACAGSLAEVFIVSSVAVEERAGTGDELVIRVEPATAAKCARCWNRRDDVGRAAAHPDVCGRCAAVLAGM